MQIKIDDYNMQNLEAFSELKKKDISTLINEALEQYFENEQKKLLEKNIEDESNNTTRFIIIGQQQSKATGKDKTSLLISTANRAGALQEIIKPFAKYQISMSHIESRPSKQGLWDYVFFIDINGHRNDENVSKALDELKANVNVLNILGSYPKAVI